MNKFQPVALEARKSYFTLGRVSNSSSTRIRFLFVRNEFTVQTFHFDTY